VTHAGTDGEQRVNNSRAPRCATLESMNNLAHVVTVTPAPSIDRTYQVHAMSPGEVHRAHRVSAEFAGKGVNVSRGLGVAGISSLAVVPLSHNDQLNWAQDTMLVPSLVPGSVRVSITVTEDDGRTTKINEYPPALATSDWQALQETTLRVVSENNPSWLLIAGTMPLTAEGTALDLTDLCHGARELGCSIAIDTSGVSLANVARAGLPDVIKPNTPELAECVQRSLHTLGDVLDAALEVVAWGVSTVLVSLGGDGMVGVSATQAVHSWTNPVRVANTIGAGDASVAGFLAQSLEQPANLGAAVANAVAWGAHKVQQPSSQLHNLENLPEVFSSTSPDRSRNLDELGLVS